MMEQNAAPFFSIIITTYNRPDKLQDAIASVLEQDFTDFEVVIVNDGSGKSYAELEEYIKGKAQIRYFYKKNEERSVARNFGIEKARGRWICFLDDDDIYLPGHLSFRYAAIRQDPSEAVFYYSPCIHRMADGSKRKDVIPPYSGIDILVHSGFHISTVCIAASVAKKYEFNKDLSYYEDFEYWLHLFVAERLKTQLINEYTTEYVFHDDNTVNNWNSKLFFLKLKTFRFLKQHYSDYLPASYLREKLFLSNVGLSDCLVREKKRAQSFVYLLSAIRYTRNFNEAKQVLGVIKRFLFVF